MRSARALGRSTSAWVRAGWAQAGRAGRAGGSRRPPSAPGGSSTGPGPRRARSARSSSPARAGWTRLDACGPMKCAPRISPVSGSASSLAKPVVSSIAQPYADVAVVLRGDDVLDALRRRPPARSARRWRPAGWRTPRWARTGGRWPRDEVVGVQQVVLHDPGLVVGDVLELEVVGDVAERPDARRRWCAGTRRRRRRRPRRPRRRSRSRSSRRRWSARPVATSSTSASTVAAVGEVRADPAAVRARPSSTVRVEPHVPAAGRRAR